MKIYNRYEDEHVACTIIYANTSGKVYFDEEFTEVIDAAALQNLFFKGVVVEQGGTFYKPTKFSASTITSDDKSFTASKEEE